MTLDEIKSQVTGHRQHCDQMAKSLDTLLFDYVQNMSLIEAQDIVSNIKSALDGIESAIGYFDAILGEPDDGQSHYEDDETEDEEEMAS